MSPRERRLEVVILAGGRSRRMGCEKALVEVGGRTLLRRLIDDLAPLASRLVVSVASAGPSRELAREIARAADERGPEITIVRDGEHGSEGPLCGILAGSSALRTADGALFVSVDTPAVDAGLIALLLNAAADPGALGAVPRWRGRSQPVHAVYRRGVASALEELLRSGERRAMALAEMKGVAVVEVDDVIGARVLAPLNSPEQLAALRDREAER